VSDLEQRLRRDLKDLSERVGPDSIRPLRVPVARRRSRVARWLAPVAAVAAVVGVITGVSVASPPVGHLPASLPASLLTPGQRPPYYVAVNQTDSPAPQGIVNWAIVHDSATGAALTTMRLPTLTDWDGGAEEPSITAAADDRTFVITETSEESVGHATKTVTHKTPPTPRFPHGRTFTSHIPVNITYITRFYRLRVAADGRSASVAALPVSVPGSLSVADTALSPDGSRLAMAVQSCHAGGCQYTGIRVVTLATGAASTWTSRANGAPFSISWAGNEQVAFQWQSPGPLNGYRLLNITGAGRDLLAASQAIAGPAPVAADGGYVPQALVTPDGVVITTEVQNIPEGNGRVTVVARFVALSASTGQLLRVLYTAAERGIARADDGGVDQECNVVALGPTGVHVLAFCFDGYGRLDGGRFTPLPGIPNPNATTLPGPYISGIGTW